MLDLLQIQATHNGLTFALGTQADLNNYADSVAEGSPKILFYSCFQATYPDMVSGYLVVKEPIEIYILGLSNLTDEPVELFRHVTECRKIAYGIYASLNELYTVENVKVEDIKLAETDNTMTGVVLTGLLTLNPESLC